MNIKQFEITELLASKKDLLKLHLYFILLKKGTPTSESNMELIIELFLMGGYATIEEQVKFIDNCLAGKVKRSRQSIRNSISRNIKQGIFIKKRNCHLEVSEDYLPKTIFDKLILKYTLSHAD